MAGLREARFGLLPVPPGVDLRDARSTDGNFEAYERDPHRD
jgi:hypothetical protein